MNCDNEMFYDHSETPNEGAVVTESLLCRTLHVTDHERSGKDDQSLLRSIQKAAGILLDGNNLLALLSVCGSVRFTVDLYDQQRSVMKWLGDEVGMPAYKTVVRMILAHALQECFTASEVIKLPCSAMEVAVQTRPHPDNVYYTVNTDCRWERELRVALPSEWARMDVMTFSFYDNMRVRQIPGSQHMSVAETPKELEIERTDIVNKRRCIKNADEFIYATRQGVKQLCHQGTVVTVKGGDIPPPLTREEVIAACYCITSNTNGMPGYVSIGVIGVVGAVWCVRWQDNVTSSCRSALQNSSPWDNDVIQYLSTEKPVQRRHVGHSHSRRHRRKLFTDEALSANRVVAGDICALLQPFHYKKGPTLRCIVVYRFRKSEGEASKFMLWLKKGQIVARDELEDRDSLTSEVKAIARQIMYGIPIFLRAPAPQSHGLHGSTPSSPANMPPPHIALGNCGNLSDGMKFFVYKVLLRCDDFKLSSSLASTGSVGGCYLLPLGLSTRWRASRAAVRIVSLTPPGVSTRQVLLHIITDIVKSSAEGVNAANADGDGLRVFVDVVGFVADYLAAADAIDMMGHTSNTPCTHCSIRRLNHTTASDLGFTKNIHGRNPAFMCCAGRQNALRHRNITDLDARHLGMLPSSALTDSNCPLIALHREMEKVRLDVPFSASGTPVVPALFDLADPAS